MTKRYSYLLHLTLLLAVLFGVGQKAKSQIIVTVGTGTNESYSTGLSPFGTYYHDDKTQFLYHASDIIAAGGFPGFMTALAFNVGYAAGQPMNSFNIEVGTTSATSISGFMGGLTNVYTATSYNTSTGWNVFNFSTPFFWNGTDNVVVSVCFDNNYYTDNSSVYYWQPSYYATYCEYADSWAGPGCSISGGNTYNDMALPNTQFHFLPGVADDAGIGSIISPELPTCDLDSVDITVELSNVGSDTLFTCDIKWQIGSGSVNTFNYSGAVAPQGGTDVVTISNVSFTNGQSLTIWTVNPNGNQDSISMNDTASMVVATGLAGTYAIPGDYATLGDAADALNTFGVCDDVIFNIATGTYNEQLTLYDVLGTSENATITFQSATGNAADVLIEFESTTQSDNWVIKLEETDWVSFNDLTVRNNGQYEYANGFSLVNGAEHVTIDECHIISNTYGYWSIGNYETGIYSSGANHNLTITNNLIELGTCGIYMFGNSSNRTEGVLIEGNNIEDIRSTSVYIYYADEVSFLHNTITADDNLDYYSVGLQMYYSDNFNVIGNYIGSNYLNGYAYALLMENCYGSNNPRSQVANNCFHAGSETSSSYGYNTVYMYSTGILDLYHNTMIRHGWSGNTTLYISNGGLIRMKNNVMADMNDGYAFQSYGVFSLTESDHNNFYTTGGNPIYWGSNSYNDLAAFQEASGFDMNSVASDPNFVSVANCITCNDEIDGGGTPLATVSDDIGGNVRSVSAPDLGAVEFVNGSSFSLGPDTTMCATTYLVEAGPALAVVWNVNGSFSTGPDYELTTSGIPQTFVVSADVTTEYCGNGDDTVTITLIPNAELDSTAHICADESVSLIPGGGANATYQWNTGETTPSINVSTAGYYSVTKEEDGCESEATIEITQSVAVDIIDLEPCEDDGDVTIDATIPDGTTYAWSGGATPNAAENTFNTSGTYAITATDLHGCVSVDSFSIDFLAAPQPVITYVGTAGLAIYFSSASSQNLGANTTYLWTFNGTDTSTAPNPSYVFPWSASPVTYPVMLEVDNGCGAAQAEIQVTIDPLGIENVDGKQSFFLFPNPASDVVYLKGAAEWSTLEVSITDNAGRLVQSGNYTGGNELIELNTSGLANGSYLVKITSENASEIHSLIVQ